MCRAGYSSVYASQDHVAALLFLLVCCFNIRKFSMCFVSTAGTLNVNVKKEISSPAQHCSFEEAIKGTKLILIVVVNNLTINSYPNLEE